METVVIEDDTEQSKERIPPYQDSEVKVRKCFRYASILEKHLEFWHLLNTMLAIEDTEMLTIIDRTLLPLFHGAKETFIHSQAFSNVVKKYKDNIVKSPDCKYSHIKQLCESLYLYKHKKNECSTFLSTCSSDFMKQLEKLKNGYQDSHVKVTKCFKFSSVLKKHCDFWHLLNTILAIEDDEIPTIVNNTLLQVFQEAEESYLKSKSFSSVVKYYHTNIVNNPGSKYTYIKQLCETLHLHKKKKRVDLITLSTSHSEKTKRHGEDTVDKKSDVIILEDDPEFHVPIQYCLISDKTKKNGEDKLEKKSDVIILDDDPTYEVPIQCRLISDKTKKNSKDKVETQSDVTIVDDEPAYQVPIIEVDDGDDNQDNVVVIDDDHKENESESANVLVNKNKNRDTNREKRRSILNSQGKRKKHSGNVNKHAKKNRYSAPVSTNQTINITYKSADTNVIHMKYNEISTEIRMQSVIEKAVDVCTNIILEPHTSKSCSQKDNMDRDSTIQQPVPESSENQEIAAIERQIAAHKDIIEKLENEEVTEDSNNSPYVRLEYHKAKVVSLYKKICKQTGVPYVKRHKIHLLLTHHTQNYPGPARILEEYLNSRVGTDGYPLFPSFSDVLECVSRSNVLDGLGWSNDEMLRAATNLFTECGVALQKNRKKREYKDLLSLVKTEVLMEDDDDPANKDPELMARLELNRQIAVKKETSLIDRYASLSCRQQLETIEFDKLITEQIPETTRTNKISNISPAEVSSDTDEDSDSSGTEQCSDMFMAESISNNKSCTEEIPYTCSKDVITNKPPEQESTDHGLSFVNMEEDTCLMKDTELDFGIIEESFVKEEPVFTGNITIDPEIYSDTSLRESVPGKKKKHPITLTSSDKETNSVVTTNTREIQNYDEISNEFEEENVSNKSDDVSYDIKPNIIELYQLKVREKQLQKTGQCNINIGNPKRAESEAEVTENDLNSNLNSEINNDTTESYMDSNIIIKKEIQEKAINKLLTELEDFGDNYTVKVFDIEDPFLVIDISSDSSDEESDN